MDLEGEFDEDVLVTEVALLKARRIVNCACKVDSGHVVKVPLCCEFAFFVCCHESCR